MRHNALLFVFSLVAALPAAAQVKPEITFLIDAPHRAQTRLDGALPQCFPRGTADPGALDVQLADSNRPALQVVKEALAGGSTTPFWCTEHDPQWRADNHLFGTDGLGSTYRAMCCSTFNAGQCARWAPCGNDHGDQRLDGADDATLLGIGDAIDEDGLVQRYNERIKFGLMVTEAEAVKQNPLSYAGERVGAGNTAFVSGQATRYGLALRADGLPVGFEVEQVNVGLRDAAVKYGRLQPGHLGVLIGGDANRTQALTENPSSVRAHNDLIMREIRNIVPYGHTNLPASLHDAWKLYRTVDGLDGADAQDGASLCRRRFLVVIGDGADTPLYGGEACNIGADNAPVVDAADCSGGRGTCMRLPALDANLAVKGCPCDAALNEVCLPVDPAAPAGAQACMVPACSYPEGYPYEKADTYAAHLYGLGVTVYTIAFNATPEGLARMKRIAAAGSPGEGPGGRDGWFEARSEAELREALDRIANAAFAESTPAGSPVAAVPGVGDVFDGELANRDVRQVRLFAYTDSGVGLDSVRYGRIQQQVLGCEGDPAPGERAIKVLGERRLDEIYADQAKVRTVSRNPINRAAFAVTGAGAAMFQEDGAALAADLNEAISLTGVADNLLLRTIGHLFHGHFGDAGLPGGQPGPRQIGAILNGDRTLVETPAIGLNLPSYEQFFQDQRLRPTLLASGAQDGKVHVFRVDTGQEVVSFLPRLAWNEARTGGFPSDGPLSSGDVVACRGLGIGAGGDCPGELTNASFRTLLVGGVGRGGGSSGGRNLFGVDLTNVNNMAAQMDADLDAAGSFSRDGQPMLWNVTGPGTSSTTQVAQLGNAVSRPVLGHVRIGDEIRAVAIAGCGDDPDPEQAARANPAGVGRCVLIIDAVTGALLADPITSNEMVYPMVGSPAVYPAATTAPIERIYIGDRQGQLFRIDLRDTLSANWRADKAWPPEEIAGVNGVNPAEYSLGRAVLGAPAVASAEDGNLVVVFGQGESGDGARANAVSFTDRAVLENGQVRFQVEGNWVLPLREGESIVSEPIVLDSVVYTTTTEQVVGDELCLPSLSRLYAMHFTDITVNDEGEKQTYTREDNTAIYVKPMLPRVQEDGTADTPGLSLVLAPGLKAYGMTIVRTPSCRQEEGPTTDLILSAGSDSSRANAGQAQGGANRQRIEYRSDNNQLASVAYDRSVFVESSGVGLRVCLNCDRDGNAAQGFAGRLSPFPSQVLFWGTSFSD